MEELDVTSLVLGWHAALVPLFERFLVAGYDADSDAWDNVCGELYRSLVLQPALDLDDSELRFPRERYGLRDWTGQPHDLWFRPMNAAEGLMLRESETGTWVVVQRPDGESADQLRFEAFDHPFREGTDPGVLEWAHGSTSGAAHDLFAVEASRAEYFIRRTVLDVL